MDKMIYHCLSEGDFDKALLLLRASVPGETARRLSELGHTERWALFQRMERSEAFAVFMHMDDEEQANLLETMGMERAKEWAGHLPNYTLSKVYSLLSRGFAEALIDALPAPKREGVRKILKHDVDSVARIMRSDFLAVPGSSTVAQVLERLRGDAALTDDASSVCFITDEAGHYRGYARLAKLLRADADAQVDGLAESRNNRIVPSDDKVEAARMLQRVNLPVLPVVDADDRLVGVVRFDDAMDVIDEETSEDVYKMAGVGSLVHAKELVRSERLTQGGIGYPVRVRLAFLMVTLAGGLMVGGLIDHFEEVLAAVVALAVFIPLVMDMGGNVGTQSTTIFARGLALGHINLDAFFRKHLAREVVVGLVMGVLLGTLAGLIAWWWQGAPNDIPQLGIVVGFSLFFAVTTASLLGFLLPWVMLKIGVDHAPGADPFITTIKDFSGLAVYFLMASWLIGVHL